MSTNACIKCKHRVRSVMNFLTTQFLECKHPSIPVDPITGKPGTQFCSIQRRGMGSCGPKGSMYEPL